MSLIDKIIIKIPVYPTENKDKLKNIMKYMFPGIKIKEDLVRDSSRDIEYTILIGESNSLNTLEPLRRTIEREGIKQVFKDLLLYGERDFGFEIWLDKQTLLKKKITYVTGEKRALGYVKILIYTKKKELLRKWFIL